MACQQIDAQNPFADCCAERIPEGKEMEHEGKLSMDKVLS
jgi:hypothetical protein